MSNDNKATAERDSGLLVALEVVSRGLLADFDAGNKQAAMISPTERFEALRLVSDHVTADGE